MKLGQKVTFRRTLTRVHIGAKRTWVYVYHPRRTGYFMGYRTLNEGNVSFNGEYREFHRTGSIRAALVVFDPYKAPLYIPREDVK